MGNRKLSTEELKEMKAYIISRSTRFAEPSILVEIMDHFACKTEEILAEKPSLSFKEAMKSAHESFGIKGFAPIAAAWETHTISRYKRWRQKENRNILFSIHGLGLLTAAILMAKIFLLLLSQKLSITNGAAIIFPLLLLYSFSVYPISRKKTEKSAHPLLYGKALEANYSIFITPFILIPIINELDRVSPLIAAIVIGAVTFTFGINIIINKRLLKKVVTESEMVDTQLNHL